MVNLKNFIVSLKCTWIQRVIKGNHSWLSIFENNYEHDVIDKLFNTGNDYVLKLLKCTTNKFWRDVLESWLSVTSDCFDKAKLTHSEILSTPVWFNSCITVNGKSIFIKDWYDVGVKIVDDFLDNNGLFYTREKFAEIYKIHRICFMKYNSTVSAISKFLKGTQFSRDGFIRLQRPYLPMLYKILLLTNKCTKSIYKNINSNNVEPTAFSKWNFEMRLTGHTDVELKDIFKVCFKVSASSSIQWLQYRILHRIVPVKYYL